MSSQDSDLESDLNQDEETEFTSRQILLQTSDPSIATLYDKEKRKKLVLQPEFQRQFVWDIKKASRLVESVLLGIPLPTIYLANEKNGISCVIDGQQRLTSLLSFYSGSLPNGDVFALKGLNVLKELNGKTFGELNEEWQEMFSSYALRVITFLKESDENLKFEIFERLNMGSVQLKEQELRNSIYRGKFNDLTKKLAQYKPFRELMGYEKPQIRMQDVEMVLRFCAFYHLGADNFKQSLKHFMNIMADKGRNLSDSECENIEKAFKDACQIAYQIFGKYAFKRFHSSKPDKNIDSYWDIQFNGSLYDIVMTEFALRNKNQLMRHSDAIREALIDLMANDDEFNDILDRSTGNLKNVKLRFKKWRANLDNILLNDNKEPRTFSLQLKKQLWQQNPICGLCGNTIHELDDAAIDHIQQYWHGGKTIPENARLAHRFCNNSRARKE